MHKTLSCMAMMLVMSIAYAGIDLSDFDKDAMRAIDDSSKDLESSIADKDVEVTVSNAEYIRDKLKWAEQYFTAKGNVEDAVRWAKQARELADAIAKQAREKSFDAAADSFVSLKRNCKTCHDAYKPPSL